MQRLEIQDRDDLLEKIDNYFNDDEFRRNNPIGTWNVSRVTDMSFLFSNYPEFNESINDWDVSNVTNMRELFSNCGEFNQPLNNWNTQNVTTMENMFNSCLMFNQPLNNWNTGNVTNMTATFTFTENFNQPLNNWNTANVTDMSYMFFSAKMFNQPLDNWNTQNVTNMSSMFSETERFNQPLNNWNIQNVTNMSDMFSINPVFNQPLDNWNTENVTDMSGMFLHAVQFNQPLNNWNTSHVINMAHMFNSARRFNQPLENWDVSNVETMDSMFTDAIAFNQPLANWNVTRCMNFSDMFILTDEEEPMSFHQDLSGWNLSGDATIDNMFEPDFPQEFRPTPQNPTRRQRPQWVRAEQRQAPTPFAPRQPFFEPPQQIQQPQQPVQQGIAYQVHNKFANLDIQSLANLIKSGPTLDEYMGDNLNQEWLDELQVLAENSGNPELPNKLSRISGKIRDIDFAKSVNNINGNNLFYTILNFVKRQPKDYQDNYVNFLVEDSCNAYDNGDTTSCVKGIKERMLLSLGQAGYNLNSELYNQISAILFQVKDSQIYHFISNCLETNKSSFVGKPMEEKKQLLLDCVNQRLRASGEMGVNSKIMELINLSEDMLDDDALTGGKRKRTRRRLKNIFRKTKRVRKRKRTNKRRNVGKRKTRTKTTNNKNN